MPDLLVKLYEMDARRPEPTEQARTDIEIRRAHANERRVIVDWVERTFEPRWAAECEVALGNRPVTCFIATRKRAHEPSDPYDLAPEELLGFAAYDASHKGMFGPEGVRADMRGHGLGRALLRTGLRAMTDDGYAYAVIGWAGPVEFYRRVVGATVIESSEPGPYRGKLTAD